MRPSFRIIAAGIVFGYATCTAYAQPRPASVVVDEAMLEIVSQFREVTGQLQSVKRSSVATREEGLVFELRVEQGDRVVKGAVLARLDDALAQIEVRRREAVLRSRKAQVTVRKAELENARRDFEQVKAAFGRSGASQSEIDNAETTLSAAEARVAEAEADAMTASAELSEAGQRLEDMTIVAPYDGSVIRKRTDQGQWVSQGDPIVDLIATGSVDAVLAVPQGFLSAIIDGASPVQIRVEAYDRVIEAPVHAIVDSANELARTIPVLVRLDNADGSLKPGMSVVGLMPTGSKTQMLTIAKDAILRNDAGAFVYFDAGGSAGVAPVEPLFAVGPRAVIRSAVLQPGMLVVTEGNERLFPGQPLMITNRPAPDATAGTRGGG